MRFCCCRLLRGAAFALSCLVGPVSAGEVSGTMVSAGYRLDSLDWNIDGRGNSVGSSPNILSELEWRDLDIFQLKGEVAGANATGIYFRGFASRGWVLDGENQDSDYAGDNRSLEFSRSINGVDGSKVVDLGGGLGYEMRFGEQGRYSLIPLAGLSYHYQGLRMTDGRQVVSDLSNAQVLDPGITGLPALGPFAGLRSSYDAEWYGPWLGADLLLDLQDSGSVFARLERHWARYSAQANWNLREEFAHPVSFEHKADGRGWVLELGWREPPSVYHWVWGVTLSLQRWHTGSGVDRTYFVDPDPPCNGNCYVEGRLNEANWSSSSLSLTLRKEFAH